MIREQAIIEHEQSTLSLKLWLHLFENIGTCPKTQIIVVAAFLWKE